MPILVHVGRSPDWVDCRNAARWVTTWFPPMGEPTLLGYPDSGRLDAYVLWSLSYEWIFYIVVFPACALAMDLARPRCPSWTVPAALLSASLALRMTPLSAEISTLRYLPLFAVGMLAHECAERASIARRLRSPAATAAAATALMVGMTIAPTPFTFAMPLFGFTFVCVACGNSMGGVLRTTWAATMGECSYGVYLLHGIVLDLLFVDGAWLTGIFPTEHLPILMPAVAVIVMTVTPLTHLLIERPAMRFERRLVGRSSDRRPRIVADEHETFPRS